MGKVYNLLIFFFLPVFVYAQEIPDLTNDTFYAEIENAANYFQKARLNKAIFNGKEHVKYPAFYIGHPFLVADQYTTGNLCCDSTLYPDVPLKLDWYTGELLINTPDQRYNIVIPSERLQYATLYNYRLFYHRADSRPGSPPDGYYLALPNSGKYPIWKKEVVKQEERFVDRKALVAFNRSFHFYIEKDGVYHKVKSKKSLLNVFPDRKKELNRFIKESRLNYTETPDRMLVAVVEQYEKLTQ